MKKLHDLKLHEKILVCKGCKAMRVPNGWIYTFNVNGNTSSTFVPFSYEFATIKVEKVVNDTSNKLTLVPVVKNIIQKAV